MEEKMVYLVSTGCYSDYTIRGVYSTEEKANRAAELYGGSVESMALDDMPDAPPGMVAWEVRMLRDGSTEWARRAYEPTPSDHPPTPRYGGATLEMWATDSAHAVKIANERRIVMLAENRWPADPPPEPEHERRVRKVKAGTTSDADEAFRRLAARVGREDAIKAVRAFQDRHSMPYGSPIGMLAEYIAALDAWPGPDPATVPTEEGKRRYPPDGFYDGSPCRCKPECEAHPCPGTCGCSACASAYGDAMDYADY
jgi:hypothetical protein